MQGTQSGSDTKDGIKTAEPEANLKECPTKAQKCLEFAKKTGYSLTIGQNLRKYGGPPPDGSERPRNAEIFLGRLPRDMYEDELVPELEKFGKLWEVRVLLDETGELGRGFAFATFYDSSVANNVVRQLTNRPIAGRPGTKWSISLSKPHALVMITNLPKHKTRADLIKDFDGLFEGVLETNIWGIDPEIRPPKLWASLEFGSERAAVGALGKILSQEVQPYDYPLEAYYSTCEDDRNAHTCVLHARNLMDKATEADLNKLFSENYPDSFERARIVNKFAFLHFRDHATADRALQEYYGQEFMGRRLELAWARTKTFVPEPPAPMRVSEESMERLNAPPQRRGAGGGRGRGRNSSEDGGGDRGRKRGGGGSGGKAGRPGPYPAAGDRRHGPFGERPSFEQRRGAYDDMGPPARAGGAAPYGPPAAPAYQPRGPSAPQPRPTSTGQYLPRPDGYYPPPLPQPQPDPYQVYSNGGAPPRYDQGPPPMLEAYRAPASYEGSLLPQSSYSQGYRQPAPASQQYQQAHPQRQPYGYQQEQPAYGYGAAGQVPQQSPYDQQDNGHSLPPLQPQYPQQPQQQQGYAPTQPVYAPQQAPYRPGQSQSSLLNPPYLSRSRGGESQGQAEPYNRANSKDSVSYAAPSTTTAAAASRPTSGKSFAARFGHSAPAEQQTNGAQHHQQTASGAYANGWEY
ncbi:hypothetical protein RvY_18972 [Ramazzottius varieornatus]|uniref:RRM domain-containing protein n=1 Tax=Ramazzottius varieornatus TaxID=947166 RepID=A0A1D1W7X7_RAMVA|nr:hypothetical protein RvY_18972 [Ramazzottius varieornatus]